LFGHLTCLAWLVHDFVVENREVKSKSESDGVGGLQVFVGEVCGVVVGLKSFFSDFLVSFTFGVLSDVPVVVAFHLQEEDLAFCVVGLRNEMFIDEGKDVVAESVEFLFNLGPVVCNELGFFGIPGLPFFNGGKSSPRRSS
jgi:hypothetical protein